MGPRATALLVLEFGLSIFLVAEKAQAVVGLLDLVSALCSADCVASNRKNPAGCPTAIQFVVDRIAY